MIEEIVTKFSSKLVYKYRYDFVPTPECQVWPSFVAPPTCDTFHLVADKCSAGYCQSATKIFDVCKQSHFLSHPYAKSMVKEKEKKM